MDLIQRECGHKEHDRAAGCLDQRARGGDEGGLERSGSVGLGKDDPVGKEVADCGDDSRQDVGEAGLQVQNLWLPAGEKDEGQRQKGLDDDGRRGVDGEAAGQVSETLAEGSGEEGVPAAAHAGVEVEKCIAQMDVANAHRHLDEHGEDEDDGGEQRSLDNFDRCGVHLIFSFASHERPLLSFVETLCTRVYTVCVLKEMVKIVQFIVYSFTLIPQWPPCAAAAPQGATTQGVPMKKYLTLYEYFRDRIRSGELKNGDRLPSIRRAAELFQVSTTTVENAFFALQAEGYILPAPKRGFFVSYVEKSAMDPQVNRPDSPHPPLRFDLKSGDADPDSFDIHLWHRYINSALRQEDRLCSYSEEQGELDLREAIADYIRDKRNVITSPDRIVVGAGVQSLMNILCMLLPHPGTVSFPDQSFQQAIQTFVSHGFESHTKDKDADIIYVSPSHMTRYGKVMPIKRRMELIAYSAAHGSLVIEDDFDNDFLYASHPTPALYTLASEDNIVYLSSFANVLTPGIRISFMVLTPQLAQAFREHREWFAQTASKTEQMALCGYLRDGHIAAQIRKIRRRYTAKVHTMCQELKNCSCPGTFTVGENGLQIFLAVPFTGKPERFREAGLAVQVDSVEDGTIHLILTPSAVPEGEIAEAARVLAECLR